MAGSMLPIGMRRAWAASCPTPHRLAVLLEDGLPLTGLGFTVRAPRSPPRHELWRIERLSPPWDASRLGALLSRLVDFARRRRVVRLEVGTSTASSAEREALARALHAVGFVGARETVSYRFARLLDMHQSTGELLRGMTAMGRRQLRKLERLPLAVERLLDDDVIPDLVRLVAETRSRTGDRRPRHLAHLVSLTRERPDLVRAVGLRAADGRLVAFATGHHDGDRVTYGEGASERRSGERLPLGYGLLWSLIGWARDRGFATFDLGGITQVEGPHDALAGISAFKRQLGGREVEVGRDHVLTLSPVRSAYLDFVSRAQSHLGGAT
jgi:hypothetical protein